MEFFTHLQSAYKENPAIKLVSNIVAVIGGIATCFGAWIGFDNYYAHATDITTLRAEQTAGIATLRQEQKDSANRLLRGQLETNAANLETKLFEVNQQPSTKKQQALVKFLEQQLRDVKDKLKALPPLPL